MDSITSTEFRRRYPNLTEPTRVTVLGRTIGLWLPGSTADERWGHEVEPTPSAGPLPTDVRSFSTKPFTPVPKRK